MKTIIKYSNCFVFSLALCAMVISGCSCSAPKPAPDPLAGFHAAYGKVSQSIVSDYQNYIKTLSPDERKFMVGTEYFEDGAGQHAVKITIGLNHSNWRHVLIYDKDDKRIKTIKYVSGNSMS